MKLQDFQNYDLTKAFHNTLFREYLEEASFLYEQRTRLFHDPEIYWLELEEFEDRLEAYIDALVVGGELALKVCLEQAVGDDFGELYTVIRVLCQHQRSDMIEKVINELDTEDEERVLAVHNALKLDWPRVCGFFFEKMLMKTPRNSIVLLSTVTGYSRVPNKGTLMSVLPLSTDHERYAQLKSMGRLKISSAQIDFFKLLKHEDKSIREIAALNLTRMGISLKEEIPEKFERLEFWQLMHIAFAGGPQYIPRLLDWIKEGECVDDAALVIGILGDPQSVELLINCLDKKLEAETVAIALNLITGAELYEDVFVPEQVDEDELFDDEVEMLAQGVPLFAPGEEPGTTLEKLSQDPKRWYQWWQQNRSDFEPGVRYRNGIPYTALGLVDNLRSEKNIILVRQIAYEELVVRYGVDISFETDMMVKDQIHALQLIESVIADINAQFQPGGWYFAGHEVY